MANASTVVIGFVLERLEEQPVKRRAELYRALARLVATNAEKKSFEALAADCDAIDAAHAQLLFDFRRRNGGVA